MSDNKKYYYLKFKENYFNQDQIKIIESMKDGYIYSLILLKLYLKSLKYEGQLKINDTIPYTNTEEKINFLAKNIDHKSKNVKKTIEIAKEFGIIEILNNGEIYIIDIQNHIGKSSSEGDRKRKVRKEIKDKNTDKCPVNVHSDTDICPPELELELKKELELKLKKAKEKIQNDIDEIYKTYPGKCPISNKSTQRCSKDKKTIETLLKSKKYTKDSLIEIIELYVKQIKKINFNSTKHFKTFLNNIPEKDSLTGEIKERPRKTYNKQNECSEVFKDYEMRDEDLISKDDEEVEVEAEREPVTDGCFDEIPF